mmetsp:Transcript_52654/g.78036  ORF Transcript_52654/g.78036 Transcript_52654/m.78036 type:complete len:308 (+) Transcript_52654:2-925(+)
MCAQIRPPNSQNDAKQHIAGIAHGISVIVTGLSDMYPLSKIEDSTPAVDFHIQLNQGKELTFDDSLFIEPHVYTSAAAGGVLSVEYSSKKVRRYSGWGKTSSRTCKDTGVPRDICAFHSVMKSAPQICGCGKPQLTKYPFLGCGVDQLQCLAEIAFGSNGLYTVPLEDCPYPCNTSDIEIVSQSSSMLSDGQILYFQDLLNLTEEQLNRDNTALIKIGLRSLSILELVESPSTSFGEMMGTIGGNIGLWCGLSFLTLIEVIEFLIVACLFGRRVAKMKVKKEKESVAQKKGDVNSSASDGTSKEKKE